MKIFLVMIALMLSGTVAIADSYVRGYTRKDGTYVQGHYRSSPDATKLNNYSTQGNTNPYTGQRGSKDPYSSDSSYNSDKTNGNGYGNRNGYGYGQ